MENTARGYRFPGELEPADIAPYFQNLATDVNDDVQGIADQISAAAVGDSGHKTSGISITFANGWGGGITQDWRIRNGVMFLTLTASRGAGTATLTGASDGNLTPNNLVLTMNDHRPGRNQWAAYLAVGAGGGCLLDTGGNLNLRSLHANAVIQAGDTIRCTFTYDI